MVEKFVLAGRWLPVAVPQIWEDELADLCRETLESYRRVFRERCGVAVALRMAVHRWIWRVMEQVEGYASGVVGFRVNAIVR